MNQQQSRILKRPASWWSTKRPKRRTLTLVATPLDDDFTKEISGNVFRTSLLSAAKTGPRLVRVHKMQVASQSTVHSCPHFAHRQNGDVWKLSSCHSHYNDNATSRGARVSRLLTQSFSLWKLLAIDHPGKSITATNTILTQFWI